MKLNRSDPNFSSFTILRRQRWWEWVWSIITFQLIPRYAGYAVLSGILEADDSTGLIVRQDENERGEPLYINAAGDEVVIDNTLKVLLLLPDLRNAFIQEFIPKTRQSYVEGLVITRQAVSDELVPVVVDKPPTGDGETFIMKGGYDG